MAIQINQEKIRIHRIVFQARYTEGFRFLNRSGELLLRIRSERPEWQFQADFGQIMLNHKAERLNARISVDDVNVSFGQPIDLKEGQKKVETFAQAADWLYETVVDAILSPRTIRVGIYFQFIAPADSIEECDRLTWKVLESPLQKWVTTATNCKPVEAVGVYFVEDAETGIRRSIHLSSSVFDQPPGAQPPMGFDDVAGNGCLSLESDTYARPNEGHYPKIRMFVQEQYALAKKAALEIFRNCVTQK